MIRPLSFLSILLVLACAAGWAEAEDLHRLASESDLALAGRALGFGADADAHVVRAAWNGTPTLFADYLDPANDPDKAERRVFALTEDASGGVRKVEVTTGEQEGGAPQIAALGFARAEPGAAKDLIVILAWPQMHADVEGTLYEVRVFSPPRAGQGALTLLKISDHFGSECDCQWSDGTSKHYAFKTVAKVKAELKRMGY